MSPVRIKNLQDHEFGAWDRFVETESSATFYHLAGWRSVLERGLRLDAPYLYADRGGAIAGVLPLGLVTSLLFGDALVSTPYCVYGGAVAPDGDAVAALEAAAVEIAAREQAGYLEVRNLSRRHPTWPESDAYWTFRKPLSPVPEENFRAIPRKQRAMVRKGIANALTSTPDPDPERFYPLYAESVRNLGVPVYPRRFVRILFETFAERAEILFVTKGGKDICAVLSFYFRDQVLPFYAGGTPAARGLMGYDFMYWTLMQRACGRGVRMFDFGRSIRGTGAFRFKKHWGFEPQQLHYHYELLGCKRIPALTPFNPKYRLAGNLWKRLPLSLANRLGPLFVRGLR